MLQLKGQSLLFLGAHPDDIELGAGALVHQVMRSCHVQCVTLSENQRATALGNLLEQHRQSMSSLGVPDTHIHLGPFETRKFHEARQEILDFFVQLRKQHRPDVVFVHSPHDVHQDHNVMSAEALRAFRGTTLLGFEIMRSCHGFVPQLLLEVSEEDVQAKLKALSMYEIYRDKSYFNPDVVRAGMLRHGELAELPYAEGFEILRGVARFD